MLKLNEDAKKFEIYASQTNIIAPFGKHTQFPFPKTNISKKKQKLLFSCKRKQTDESIVSLLQLTRSNCSVGGGGKLALTSTFLPETCLSFVKRFFVKILTGLANNHVVCSLCSPFLSKKETLAQDIKLCARLSKHFVSGCRDEE